MENQTKTQNVKVTFTWEDRYGQKFQETWNCRDENQFFQLANDLFASNGGKFVSFGECVYSDGSKNEN